MYGGRGVWPSFSIIFLKSFFDENFIILLPSLLIFVTLPERSLLKRMFVPILSFFPGLQRHSHKFLSSFFVSKISILAGILPNRRAFITFESLKTRTQFLFSIFGRSKNFL